MFIDEVSKLDGTPDATIDYDIIRVVKGVDNKMQQPYIHGIDYITIDFRTFKHGVPTESHTDDVIFTDWIDWIGVNDQEDKETPQGLCEDLPLICRSQWDRLGQREQSLFELPPNGLQRTRPFNAHTLHTITLRERLLSREGDSEQETGL